MHDTHLLLDLVGERLKGTGLTHRDFLIVQTEGSVLTLLYEPLLISRLFRAKANQHRSSTAENLSVESPSGRDPPPSKNEHLRLRIIERLRQWEATNASTFVPPPEPNDHPTPGDVVNSWTRPGSEDFTVDPNLDGTNDDIYATVFGQDDLLDVGNSRTFLRPGDLVELV
jgi:hypothetical protein